MPSPEKVADEWASLTFVLSAIAVQILIQLAYEAVFWWFVYRHEEYHIACEKTRNLGKRVKELKDLQLYGGGKKGER